MKSSIIDLRNRGYIEDIELNKYKSLSTDDLYKLSNSDEAFKRTISIKLLSERISIHNEYFVEYLLDKLAKEKSLYTRLQICKVLEDGNENTCKILINYLGKIGSNQYKELPNSVSKKVSYPIPRDIVARILGKMNSNYFPIIISILKNNDILKISEVIDAIGYMIFYNKKLDNTENFNMIKTILEKYKKNDIIVWKCIMCLSAFSLEENKEYLNFLKNRYKSELINLEIDRSLKLIKI